MKPSSRRYLHLLGATLGISGVFFVAERLYRYADQIDIGRFVAVDWLLLVGLACVYGAANLLLAVAWQRLLAFLDVQVSRRWAIGVYSISQLAKYVPGNIFQFAGRQAIGMAAGIAGPPLLKSTFYELGGLALVGGMFGVLILPLLWQGVPEWTALLCFGGLLACLGWVLRQQVSHHIGAAWVLHALFLGISSMVFCAILWIVSSTHHIPAWFTTICGAYVLAWLIGLAMPGAPAGVGVREAVLLFLLGKLIAPGELVLTVVIGRMVTVAGDLGFFLSFCRFRAINNDKNNL